MFLGGISHTSTVHIFHPSTLYINARRKNYMEKLIRQYDRKFVPDEEYLKSMPDIQNEGFTGIPINLVGMAGIKRPFTIKQRDGKNQEVLAHIIGQVDNDALSRGINMSRISRELSVFDFNTFNMDELGRILQNYKKKLDRMRAGLNIAFEYRLPQCSLRSKDMFGNANSSWSYTPVEFELHMDDFSHLRKILWVYYIYSSTCPCSTELSLHAGETRRRAASPHAQRSVAKIGIEFTDMVWIEDVLDACRRAVPTEVQTYVKREDEQAFAELCASEGTVFVEDAIRRFARELDKDERIKDYKIMCLHEESLHPWGAHAVMIKNVPESLFTPTFSMSDRKDLAQYV